MFFNIAIGFLIPWVFGFFLYRKTPILVLLIGPATATISAFINDIGYHLEFWDFTPRIANDETLSALPFDLGMYPVLACYLVYWIRSSRSYALLKLLAFGFLTTVLEFIAHLYGKVEYGNGWNVVWTLVSYLFAYGLVYAYYKALDRYGLFRKG